MSASPDIQLQSVRAGACVHLEIRRGGRLLIAQRLVGNRLEIGRSDTCDIALPSDRVSRSHCVLELRPEGWWVVDHSRHGTFIDGARIVEHALVSGDAFTLADYEVTIVANPAEDARLDAETHVGGSARHEELLAVGPDGVATTRAVLRFHEGPMAGTTWRLTRARTLIGGRGAHVVVDKHLPPDALAARVVRGRVILEPGARPTFLSGQRVREATPALAGEAVRMGEHGFTVDTVLDEGEEGVTASFGELVGSSPGMLRLFQVLSRIARHDATVLLVGESGTGKELGARGLHDTGPRFDGPFVAVNCASIPQHLVESELFGHEKGAFTGAEVRFDGAFQRADGGTLFLDELGEMSADVQAKLLRVLETGEVRRVGGRAPELPDVRVVAATHRDLVQMVREGTFREDLFYRLVVITVRLPPVREHKQDLGFLAERLLARHHPGAQLAPGSVAALERHDWPGNVRELRNVLTRAVVLHGSVIRPEHLSFDPWGFSTPPLVRPQTLEDAERQRIVDALARHDGNRARAAVELGIPRTTLIYKMRKLEIA